MSARALIALVTACSILFNAVVLPSPASAQTAGGEPVTPVAECVVDNGGKDFTAWFGYNNPNASTVSIPVSSGQNKFTPAPQNRGQATSFLPGRNRFVFSLPRQNGNLVWHLNQQTARASLNQSPRCSPVVLDITGPENNSTTVNSAITVSGRAYSLLPNAGGIASVFVNNVRASYTAGTNNWSLTNVVLSSGENTINVRAVDGQGNEAVASVKVTSTGSVSKLDSIEPNRGTQGQTLQVTLRGSGTNWVSGQTQASFGGEIAVGGAAAGELGQITVIDQRTAVAEIVVSPTAALAPRTIRVVTLLGNGGTEDIKLENAFTVLPVAPPGAFANNVKTIAGSSGQSGSSDGAGAQARFKDLAGITVGADDAVYVADAGNHRVRVVREQSGGTWNVQTLAGNGTVGFADGVGTQAKFNNPQGVAVGLDNSIYVADAGNNRIRRIAPDGTVGTLAGNGTAGFVNGAGTQAQFNNPRGIAVDNAGNIYVADTGNSAVRRIDLGGNVATIAGNGIAGSTDSPDARFSGLAGIAVDGDNVYVYIADGVNHRIRRLDSTGSVMTLSGAERGFADGFAGEARFAEPTGIAVDAAGRLVIADTINSLIRSVSPDLSASGSPLAVTTIAGAGERGSADGNGSIAKFNLPRGVAIARSSAIIVADTGNQTLRRIGLAPQIGSFTPASGRVGDTVTIYGDNFDSRAKGNNTVAFAKMGGGTINAPVMSVTRTQLSVIVPAQSMTGRITVTTGDGSAASATNFQLETTPPPSILGFTPTRGPVGTAVKLTGTNFRPNDVNPLVSFAGPNNTRLNALVNSATAGEANVLVPNGAVTGVIELTTTAGTTATAQAFVVDDTQEFQITVMPSTVTAVARTSGTAMVSLTSSSSTFTQLAKLSAVGLPAGVAGTFEPQRITAGASSTLRLDLANANISSGSFPFVVKAAALVEGREVIKEAPGTLSIVAAGQTTISGRVLNTESEPVVGAAVSLDGRSVTTDSSGSFLLSGVTAGTARPIQIDGRTASAPNRTYPVITEPANIIAGQANQVPYIFYLPPIDTQYEVTVVPGQNTPVGNPRVPGLDMTIPAGANLRNRDGSPVTRVSITPLAIDRTPTPLPPGVKTGLVYTSQPGGALTDVPIPVVYPNLLGDEPGKRVELYAFNHDTVKWYIYGYGRVSADGRTIAPEINPNTGKQYGLPDFSWHFPNAGPGGNPGGGDGGGKGNGGGRGDGSGDEPCAESNQGNNPVNYSTGIKLEKNTDIFIEGNRGDLELTRSYTSDLAQTCDQCPFGRGGTFNYAIRLSGNFQVGGAGRVIMPTEATGQLFSYAKTDGSGALVFTAKNKLIQLADELRKLSNGIFEYRYADGSKMEFDAQGRLTAEVDRNENKIFMVYSGNNLTQVTDAVGRSLNFQYDTSNRITQVTDPINRVWKYTYEGTPGVAGSAGLTTVTDPSNNVVRYAYAAGGRLASITDAKGNFVKRISYNSQGRVVSQQFADGGTETYDYVLTGGIVTQTAIVDPAGRKTVKRFNAIGYVIENTDSSGQKAKIERNLTNNLAQSTSGSGGCTEQSRQYDERGNILSETGSTGETSQMEYVPDTNYISKLTDKNGQAYIIGYDSNGSATSFTDSLGRTTSSTFNSFGQMTSITNALGHKTLMEYDGSGNLSASTDPAGSRVTFDYDGIGRRTAIIDPLGRRTEVKYDASDRITSFKDASGTITLYEYDANDNLKKMTDALGRTWLSSYDEKNRVTSATDPLGRKVRYRYNSADEIASVITPENRTINYNYNERGELVKIIEPSGYSINYTYDYKGNLLSIADQRGNVTSYVYDQLYRPIKKTNPLGQSASVKYNPLGQVSEATDVLGRKRTTTYDTLGRPSETTFADSQTNYEYDAIGRVERVNDTQGGSINWTYDNAGRVLSETSPGGKVSYSYNKAGQRISMTAGNRASVLYDYDSAGRLGQIKQGTEQFDYSYDVLSRIAGLSRPNAVTTAYNYDTVGRLEHLKHTDGTGRAIEDYRYAYTPDDQIAGITSLLPANNLPEAKNYGAADAANRVRQVGQATYTYDDQGQVTSKSTAQGTAQYNWDARGRLTQAVLPGGQSVGYNYDALGRLSKRTVGSKQTSYLYDGVDVVADQNSDGSAVEYLNGAGVDDKLRQSTSATGSLYFQTDHLGSTTALTDSSGNVVERNGYTPFGQTSGSSMTRYGFTGRERDNLTGLTNFRARWYDAEQGRFISEDPIGFDGGMNFYSYVGNSPTNFVDPTGTSAVTFGKGLIAGAGWSLVWALAGSAVAALASCVTGGAAAPVIAAALAAMAGAGAYQTAMELANIIADMLTGSDCPDNLHYRIGNMIGSFIGAALGGAIGKGFKFCFVAGTLVHTKDGVKPIEEIKEGDEVLSYNEQSGQTEYQVVRQTFERFANDVLSVKVAGESAPIGVTSEHPFFVKVHGARSDTSGEDDGEWRKAGELNIGDEIRTASGGWSKVESIETRAAAQVYNFEVAQNHNYFVGGQGLLAHNTCNTPPPNLTPKGAGRSGAHKQAKRDAGIPASQQPSVTGPNLDRNGVVQPGRQYDYDVPAPGGGTRRVGIRDDSRGHNYGPGNPQNRGPHFNGPGNTHYDY